MTRSSCSRVRRKEFRESTDPRVKAFLERDFDSTSLRPERNHGLHYKAREVTVGTVVVVSAALFIWGTMVAGRPEPRREAQLTFRSRMPAPSNGLARESIGRSSER
jgi:hypothetical protein